MKMGRAKSRWFMLEVLSRWNEAVVFWCSEPDAKAGPDIDANPQLLRPLAGQYAR
jgi:hypothetical protein